MGLRFRKSIKIAPGLKINLNKNSISATVGTKGARYTINSKGKKTATVGVPGTGMSYTASSGSSVKHSIANNINQSRDSKCNDGGSEASKKKKGKGCLTVFIVIFILAAIGSVIGDDELTKITISADTKTVYDINTKVPIAVTCNPSDAKLESISCNASGGEFSNDNGEFSFTADKEGEYTLYVASGDVKSNQLVISIEDKTAKEEKKQEELETQKQAEAETQAQQTDAPVVYITNTGGKYHRSTCSTLKDSKIEKRLSEIRGSYEPCGICNPPQ